MMSGSILLVDTDDAQRVRRRDALARCGWDVQCATSATTGLAIANWFHPDVVLLDARATGIELAQFATLVRSDAANARLLLIVMAGDAEGELEDRARRADIDAVLHPSADVEAVLAAIQRLRAARGGHRDA